MRFRIDLKIFVFILLFYFTKQIEIYAMIMFFAMIHECGHLLVGLLVGMKPEKFEITPYGLSVSFQLIPRDYNKKIRYGNQLELKKIFVALAGPLMNVIIILLVLQMNLNFLDTLMILYSNLLLILFNLLPIYPLDGGRITKGILHICLGKEKAEKYTNYLSFVIYQVENIAIFIIVVVLWAIFIREDRRYKKRKEIYHFLEQM